MIFSHLAFAFFLFFSLFAQASEPIGASPIESSNMSQNMSQKTFRMPYSVQYFEINPHNLKSSSGQYFYQQLFRNWLWYDNEQGLIPDLAEKCYWKSRLKYRCRLKKDARWSDGSPLTLKEFITSYQEFLNPKNNNPRKDLLFGVMGVQDYVKGKVNWDKVEIKINESEMEFQLVEENPEFAYSLIQTITAPIKQVKKISDFKEMLFTGPFKIAFYSKNDQNILLERNNYYQNKSSTPNSSPNSSPNPLSNPSPNKVIRIEMIYLTEDSVQLPLYIKDKIDFVRRLPTSQIPTWKIKKDLFEQEVLRFDYFGFNLKKISKEQRKLAFTVLNFSELKKLLHSVDRPGCFQLGHELMGTSELCYPENVQVSEKEKSLFKNLDADFALSQLGGEDHSRTSEWIQSEWKKKLNWSVNIQILENKIFLQKLKKSTPLIFRKGVPLESPTCYGAVKILARDSSENINKVDDLILQNMISELKIESHDLKKKALCKKILEHIRDEVYLVPTGKFTIAYLVRPTFINFKFNRLNYLDLNSLSEAP